MLAMKHRQSKNSSPEIEARHRTPGERAESHVVHFNGVENDDDVHVRHKGSKVGPRTPWVITKGFQPHVLQLQQSTIPFFVGSSRHGLQSV